MPRELAGYSWKSKEGRKKEKRLGRHTVGIAAIANHDHRIIPVRSRIASHRDAALPWWLMGQRGR
jgi:hypothetical protein